ncbi:MAG: bifunctional nuclease domain-containing protein [Spirochaetota bacterium]
MGDEWTEVTIRGVVIDPMTGDPTVLLEDADESSIIAISADPSSAGTIISELEGVQQEPAHTILYRFLIRHEFSVSQVELSKDREGELAAVMRYAHRCEEYTMEIRPVDSLVVAVQTGATILAHGDLIDDGATPAAPRVLEGSDLLILSRRPSS